MATVSVNKRVKAPITDVWASWDDFGNIYKFNPSVKHSELLDTGKASTGLGARRHCDLVDGKTWVQEEIIDYQPQSKLKVVIFDGNMPLKTAVATFAFKRAGKDETDIDLTMEFIPKFGPIGQLMVPLMKPQFKKILGEMLEGNALYVTNGHLKAA